jgi:multidrug efflux pump subunit AcrA (membrane-fusion protein)
MKLRVLAAKRSRVLWIALLAGVTAFVGYRAYAPPLWMAGERDARASQRVLGTAHDERAPTLAGDWIGGEGIIEPADRESKVSAAVDSRVLSVSVKEGDHVKAGDVLVVLDDEVEKAALLAAERDVAAQRAQLVRTAAGQRPEEIQAAISDAESARARAALSRDSLARTTRLAAGDVLTPDDLEKSQHQAEIDEKAYQAAEARKRQAVDGARRDDVAIDAAKLEANLARVTQARAQYEQKIVRAPIDGEILQVKVRAGEIWNTKGSDPLVVLGDTRVLRVRMDVNERDVAQVRLGQRSFVQLPAYGDRRFPGHVVELGRRMGRKNVRSDDPTERIDTKILEVVCQLDAPEGLVPGLRVTSFLDPNPAHDVTNAARASRAP